MTAGCGYSDYDIYITKGVHQGGVLQDIKYKIQYIFYTLYIKQILEQIGFRRRHFTELTAVIFVNHLISKIDNNFIPINIYIDLPKAIYRVYF